MNRRDFILQGLKLSGALITGVGVSSLAESLMNSNSGIARAADYSLYASDLPIVENYFNFSSLSGRSSTQQIIVHHSAIGGTDSVTAADIHREHQRLGWSGIGYHMFIHKSGLIETGRPLDDIGAHTYHYNNTSIGICLSGNFDEEMPTDMQIASTTKLIGLLCQMYSLNPTEDTIFGHRDFNATACPGENLYADLSYLRQNAGKFIG